MLVAAIVALFIHFDSKAASGLQIEKENGGNRGEPLLMQFEIIGEIKNQETFATGKGIRESARLKRVWQRKMEKKEGCGASQAG